MGVEGPPRILLIVIKNSSVLDYAVPLLWKIKREIPQAHISVLYCTLNQNDILRDSTFYSKVFNACGIQQHDFADFLDLPYGALRRLWRPLLAKSQWGSLHRARGLGQLTGAARLSDYLHRSLHRLERLVSHKVNVQEILTSLNPDIVLFDNRSVSDFYGREHFYDYLAREKKKVILLPHAPHHTGTTAFTPFDERGEWLPNYCEFWMPFRFDRTWERLPEKRSQFTYVGYPGLDSEWLSWLQSDNHQLERGVGRASDQSRPLQCLFIIRKFFMKGVSRPSGHDPLAFDYDEFTYYLSLVASALQQTDADIELVVKPHPSNDLHSVLEVFEASKIPRWRIAHDSIYSQLPYCDLVISLYSTTLLIPAMAGIPVVLLHSRIQDEIHQWDEMKQLYTGLQFYLEDPEDLRHRLPEAIAMAQLRRRTDAHTDTPDIEHLRRFYPDGAMERALGQMGLICKA